MVESIFYKIRDYYLGGRSEFYDNKNLLIIDNKNNRVLAADISTNYDAEGGESLQGVCDVNSVKAINDTLFEVKSGATVWTPLYDTTKTIVGLPYYHYIVVKNNKLVELPNKRKFGFTKYVKMNDSYLNGCYVLGLGTDFSSSNKTQIVDHITPEMMNMMKNEIYADYNYHFKDKRWRDVFIEITGDTETAGDPSKINASINDSLTVIDKYNINFITQKLKALKQSR